MQNLSELDFLKDGTTILSENYSFYSRDTGGNEDKASSPMHFVISKLKNPSYLQKKLMVVSLKKLLSKREILLSTK